MISSLCFLSCEDTLDRPDCISNLIPHFEQVSCDTTATIIQYRFQGEIVYFISTGNCYFDQQYDVMNSSCEIIGSLGGIQGNSEINGLDFYDNAEFIEVIWEN